jgi:molybdate transport system ATP-binding protein
MTGVDSERMGAGLLRPRIALERVNVHLAGRRVLHDVCWSLDAGQHWAFVGANGSGKSTLLRVIGGTQWIDHNGGTRTYSADGVRLQAVTRALTWIRSVSAEQHERYARLDLPLAGRAIVESGFDDAVYVHRPLDVRESQRVDELIERFGLQPFAQRPVRELSSGQIRRLLIARALVREPQVLVLDEFTNGLDRAAHREILDFLDRIAASVTLITASHRTTDFPASITHTATVRDGRIAAAGPGRPLERRSRGSLCAPVCAPETEPILVQFGDADVYRGETLVLRNIDWTLRRGDHTAIRGANGAGKSTFAGLLAGTIAAATGATVVRFGEHGPFDVWKLKERVAHVSDDLQIAYDQRETVEDVVDSGFPSSIGLFVEPTRQQRAAAAELIDRMGLDALRDRIFTELSFGERRKVLIARSLVRRPAIFILDEVWNGLDSAFGARLIELLGEMAASGTTLVVIAHDEDATIAALTPRICTIEDGSIREERRPPPAARERNGAARTQDT